MLGDAIKTLSSHFYKTLIPKGQLLFFYQELNLKILSNTKVTSICPVSVKKKTIHEHLKWKLTMTKPH